MRRDDSITFGSGHATNEKVLYRTMCEINDVTPSTVDATEASVEPTHTMRITMRYSDRLRPVLDAPSDYWFKLARRSYVSKGVINISQSRDLRLIHIKV